MYSKNNWFDVMKSREGSPSAESLSFTFKGKFLARSAVAFSTFCTDTEGF